MTCPMKYDINILWLLVPLLLSSCVKDLEDENISINNVNCFSYSGYTYKVHPSLSIMTWSEAKQACEDLVAFGYDDWFMPTMDEMNAARKIGFTFVEGWSSSPWTSSRYPGYYWAYYDGYYDGPGWYTEPTTEGIKHSVVPMRKQ